MQNETENENKTTKKGSTTPKEGEITPRSIVVMITGASNSYLSELINGKRALNTMKAKAVMKVYDDVNEGMQKLRDELTEKYKELMELSTEN